MLSYHTKLKLKKKPVKYGTLGLSLVVAGFLTVAVATQASGPGSGKAGNRVPESAFSSTPDENAEAALDDRIRVAAAEENPVPNQTVSRHSRYGEFLDWADRPPVNVTKSYYVRLDKRGIPISHYLQPDGSYIWAYNPTTVASHGLWGWSKWKRTGDRKYRTIAIRAGEWMRDHQGKDGAWHNDFTYRFGDKWAPKGWTDGLAQGLGIALFNRLGHATGDKSYFRRARFALRPFNKSIMSQGALTWYQGHPFYDHYPQPNAYILNSHLLTLVGLNDFGPRSKRARELYWTGRETIRPMLPLYDLGPGQAAYDLTHRTSRVGQPPSVSDHYTSIVVFALRQLNLQGSDSVFRQWADRWALPKPNPAPSPTPSPTPDSLPF